MRRKKIAISQRRDQIDGRNEVRDALDIRVGQFLWDLGFNPIPLASQISDPKSYLTELSPDGFVLSGGNDIGSTIERDNLELAMLEYSSEHQLPLLGICRGMQIINDYQGGSYQCIEGHVATKHPVSGKLTENRERYVNSFHEFAITMTTLGSNLEVIAICSDGVVEAIAHQKNPWLGIMWHPERDAELADQDRQLISNHLERSL
jgi:gamma-glutamyl-gamma-aminobutyrate hydrolase PuuD